MPAVSFILHSRVANPAMDNPYGHAGAHKRLMYFC